MEELKEISNPIISKKENKKNKIHFFVVSLLILSLAFNVFLVLKAGALTGSSISENSFRLIHPDGKEPIDSNSNGAGIIQYKDLKPIIEGEIASADAQGKIGIYLQDEKTGTWLGVNEKNGFTPASMLKIPIMISILKKVERGEISLSDKIEITSHDLNSEWGDLYEKGAGIKMSILDLLEQMVSFSDNTAKNALVRQLSAVELDSVFVHVGIPDPYLIRNEQVVSPRDYNRFFKSLYYATYLSPKYSQLALELSSDGKEESLLSKGVPTEIQVAHKFGIFSASNSLGDCGIIYHQENPYFLCIMTKDLDYSKSRELIPKLSKDIYDFVDKDSK